MASYTLFSDRAGIDREVIVTKLTIDEIRDIKAAQAEADRVRYESMSEAERTAEWEARMALYREAFPNRPAPGTPEWRAWRGGND